MKRIFKAGWPVAVIGSMLCAFVPIASAAALSLPFTNSPAANLTSLKNYALGTQFTVVPITTSNQGRFFFGVFTPTTSNSKLAIHSDDGSDVTVNATGVWTKKDTGTSLGNEDSFQEITGPVGSTFVMGQHYCVSINYSNMEHTIGDKDGVTLYAFNGGGEVQDNLPVDGDAYVCVGGVGTLTTCPTYGSADWHSSAPGIASVTGNQNSGYVQGLTTGTVTITASNSFVGRTGSRVVQIASLGITPASIGTICEGSTVTFVVTNPVTGGVQWDPAGVVSPNSRTNTVTFSGGGAASVSATWNGCPQAVSTGIVVQVTSVTASTNNLCGSGDVTYTATTSPTGYEGMLNWAGAITRFGGGTQTVTYTTPGIKTVWAYCGTSARTNTMTVHKVDITNTLEYALAGGTGAPFGLSSDSVGPFTWSVTPSGPTVNGSGSTVTVSGGSTPGTFTVKASATPLPSCNDTSTLQVVQVTFSASSMAFCEGTSTNISFTVNPSSALSLLTFDTVTNTATGGTNTHAYVTVNGTNLTLNGLVAGTAYLRAKLGSTILIGPALTIVRVTFPSEPWYVGVGKALTNFVTIVPTNAPVTFDTVSGSIATAEAVAGGVKITGVAAGTTQVRATVGSGAVCSQKDVTAVRVKFATNEIIICSGNNRTVAVEVDPAGAPVTYMPTTNLIVVSVQGTNISVSTQTNVVGSVVAKVGTAEIDRLNVQSLTVRFFANTWYVAPGGSQSYPAIIEPPELAPHVSFRSSNTNVATAAAGCSPPCVTVYGVVTGACSIVAYVGSTNQSCASKTLEVVNPIVASVEWRNLDGSAMTNMNPNLGGGFRIFADSPSPNAPPENQVLVRTKLIYPVAAPNAVFLKAYDVDDPYTNEPPVDDETDPADNNADFVQFPDTGLSTDSNGILDVVFTVTMKPGDNFRVAAATSLSYFSDVGAKQNDGVNASVTNSSGSLPTHRLTPLLTVWRRLHVEVDSMMAVPGLMVGNVKTGMLAAIVGSPSTLATQIVSHTYIGDASPMLDWVIPGNGRFENGALTLGHFLALPASSSMLGNGRFHFRSKPGQSFDVPFLITKGTITASGQIWSFYKTNTDGVFGVSPVLQSNAFAGGIIRLAEQNYSIMSNTSNLVTITNIEVTTPLFVTDDDDNTLLPFIPDTSDLPRVFAPAYVQPFFGLANPTPIVPFVANLADPGQDLDAFRSSYRFDNIATEANPDFWTVYVLGAYQASTPFDSDPDDEDGIVGIVDDFVGQGAVVFIETHRDKHTDPSVYHPMKYVVSHEIGHLFNGRHHDGGLMSSNVPPPSYNFSPTNLYKIRTIDHP